MLWSWDAQYKTPTLRFSAYVVDEKNWVREGSLLPSTKWLWPVDFTFHDMIGLSTKLYRNAYGENGPFRDQKFLSGEQATLKTVSDMSLFFLMACVWFKDEILVQSPGHIERHARKRYVREHKLSDAPTVRVVALRKSARTVATDKEPVSDETKRHLHVRFVVSGHARLQACGPKMADRKLIWIDPYVKGKDDDPFKPPTTKVYAVIR